MDMLKLRPHHIDVLIKFKKNNYHLLSDEEFLATFRKRNKDLHSDDFVFFWRGFLKQALDSKFVCVFDFDTACEKCDIRAECEDISTKLCKLVKKRDIESINKLNLKANIIYSISDFLGSSSNNSAIDQSSKNN